ncbi:contractile injection system tape measure protein [Pedobacter psychroterrae]|uniref:Uncharacterized protein n=1 Tax=Pedobacter psychroterrae TaxID=2530453 RepID=A0A4R0NNG6_9SPHI|nr:contractile injection system tape measure protein [Pedobacter psychroterrae]TCD01779.1 hypothetical protein EZ437_13770 [Pedobacter psychroterrae]
MQLHIIKRQVIDLKIDGRLTANDIQDRVSQIYKDKLVPILNRYLDTLSETDRIDRISSLEIDLGVIRDEDIEFMLEEKLEEQLSLANPKITSQAKPIPVPDAGEPLSPANQPETDLIGYFLQTGTLPWWVKEDKQQAFKNAVHSLLAKESVVIPSFFGQLLLDNIALKRLIFTADDELLDNILNQVVTRYRASNPSLKLLYHYLGQRQSKIQFKQLWWTVLLTNAFRLPAIAGKTTATLVALYFDKMTAQETALLKPIATSLTTLTTFYKQKAALLQSLISAADLLPVKNLNQQKEYSKQIKQLLEREVAINSTSRIDSLYTIQNIWNKIRSLHGLGQVNYEGFNSPEQGQGKELYREDHQNSALATASFTTNDNVGKTSAGDARHTDPTEDLTINDTGNVLSNIHTALREEQKLPGESAGILVEGHGLDINLAINDESSDLPQYLQPQFRTASGNLISTFSDTDRLYIPYSGLVLLWPFLDRFFSSIHLISETGFIDAAASTKACLLLQYIAEGSQWQRFEPNLPLNKLLCGIDLFEPVDVNVEITEDELAAADHLLEAVIGNAPLWKSVSPDGLRSAYLQRDGVVSSRDGNWLLQVQRQTYDILLDRLPWSVSIVKLPWMNNLIFVEWQQS